ncbi:MAG TPA: hypothetical protein VJ865_13755 [Gemmatimonadaceae bacterium]|nr:hypothetical protein [Gemmatimonadaceae bacterium]
MVLVDPFIRPILHVQFVWFDVRKAVVAVAIVVVAGGCSNVSGASTPQTVTVEATAQAAAAAESVDPASEAALQATLDAEYKLLQAADWAGTFDYLSPRCQLQGSREDYARSMEDGYEGRDFSGPQQTLITMNGPVATVVFKSYDGKGKMQPSTWTFINGKWVYDNC